MDLQEKLEKLNHIRVEMIELDGRIKKLEWQQEESPTKVLDVQAVSHILLGQDNSETLTAAEMDRLRDCMKEVIDNRINKYKMLIARYNEEAEALLR